MSGINNVQVKIYNGSNYWVPTRTPQWGAEAFYDAQYSAGVWTTTAPWTTELTYTLKYYAEDNAYDNDEAQNGNVEDENTITFTYDTQPPQSTTTAPAAPNGLTIKWLPTISGTAEDTGTNVNIAVKANSIKINVYDMDMDQTLDTNQQWQGGDLGTWLTTTNLQDNFTTWQYVITYPTATWVDGVLYRIKTKATDLTDTDETSYPERTFRIDTSSPTPVITDPNASIEASLLTISGTADSDATNVKIRLKKVENGTTYWWTGVGGNWDAGQDDEASAVWKTYALGTPAIWQSTHTAFKDSSAFTTGTTYYVMARAWDAATNVKDSPNIQFVFDKTPPTVSMSIPPAQSGRYKVLSTVSGYCSDAPAGVQYLYLTLTDGTSYWKSVTQEWLTAVSTCEATLSTNNTYWYLGPISNYVTDKQYTLKIWGKDSVGNYNYDTYFASLTFIFDNQGPATTIAYPPATKLKTLSTISGTAKENEATYPGNVNNVKFAIQDLTLGNTYYTGVYTSSDCWTLGEQWIDATGGGAVLITWDYSFTVNYETNVWTEGHDYTIYAKSYDQTTLNEGTAASVTFTYDKAPPISSTTYPLNGKYVQPFITISGTTSDDTKTNGVGISLKKSGQYWTGSGDNWLGSEQWPAAVTAGSSPKVFTIVFDGIWTDGQLYYIKSCSTDTAYNLETTPVEKSFTIDSTTPTVTTIKPQPNYYYQKAGLVTISGTSNDLAGGNQGKFNTNPGKICIKNVSTSRYWEDNTWKLWGSLNNQPPWHTTTFTFYDVGVSSAGYWSYEVAESSWTSGQKYMVWVGVTDQATNKIDYTATDVQNSQNGITFYCDADAPDTTVINPVDNSNINNVSAPATISGTCYEQPPSPAYNAGNQLVQVKIKRQPTPGLADGTSWWVNGVWSNSEEWNDGTVYVDSWTYNWGSANMIHRTTYYVYLQAYDNALPAPGNLESDGSTIKSQFKYDTFAPTSTIVMPPTGTPHYKSFPTISGTSYDDFAGMEKVLLEIYDTDSTVYWSTVGWKSSGELSTTYFETGGLNPWTTSWANNDLWTNHHQYRIKTKARDSSQNLESEKGENTRYFIYDTTAPASYVILPSTVSTPQEYNITSMPTISGTCVDTSPGLVVGCSVAFRLTSSNDLTPGNWWSGSAWNGVNPFWFNAPLTLLGGTTYTWKIPTSTVTAWTNESYYRVYALAIDQAGNMENNGTAESSFPDGYSWFKYRVPSPIAYINFPSANNLHFREGTFASISGNSTEGNEDLQLCIRRDTAGTDDPPGVHYWDIAATSWTVVETWNSDPQVEFLPLPNWKYEIDESTWTNGAVYTLLAKAYTATYGWQTSPSERSGIVYDKTLPDSSITVPDGTVTYYKSSLATLSGPHSDISPGAVTGTEIELKKQVGSDWWYWFDVQWSSGSFWDAGDEWRQYTSSDATKWYYNSLSNIWTSNQQYTLRSRATDKAGNIQTSYGSVTFTIDDSTPTSKITEPVNDEKRSTVATISGTANDAAIAQLKEVRVAIKDEAGGWYDGTTFTVEQASWIICGLSNGVTPATWTLTGVSWANAKRYTIYLKAQDKAGNYNDTYTAEVTSITIISDVSPGGKPSSSVSVPLASVSYSTAVTANLPMSGGCSDPGSPNNSGIANGVGSVKIRLLKYFTSGTTRYYQGGGSWKDWEPDTDPFINGPTVSGGNSWAWTFLSDWWDTDGSDKMYTLETQAQDQATPSANLENITSTRTFYIDNTPPVTYTFEPQNNIYKNALATISGTINSYIAGTYGIGVSIKRNSDQQYCQKDTTTWDASAYWYQATVNGSTWTLTDPNIPDWADTVQYYIITRGTDNAVNVEDPGTSSTTFTCDKSNPSIVISSPASGNPYYNSFATISGTTNDTGSGIYSASIRVKNDTDNQWWSGTKWDTYASENDVPWLTCSTQSLPTWSYNNMQSTWVANKTYIVKAKAVDKAINQNTATDVSFVYDVKAPTSAVNSITQAYYNNSLATLSGTANDSLASPNSGISATGVKVRITNMTAAGGPWYFNGGISWTTDNTWRDADYAAQDSKWTLVINTNAWEVKGYQDTFKIESKAIDRATNEETVGTGQTAQFIYDVSQPTTTVFKPASAAVRSYYGKNNMLATISGTCSDTGSGANKVEIVLKNKDGYYWNGQEQAWKDASEGVVWSTTTLTADYTTWYVMVTTTNYTSGVNYIVWARVYDNAGNLRTYTDGTIAANSNGQEFKWDIDNPSSYVSYVSSGQYTNYYPQSLTGTSTDGGSGSQVSSIKLRLKRDPAIDGTTWWVAVVPKSVLLN